MADYLLKSIDDDLWARFKTACAQQGLTIKARLLAVITDDATRQPSSTSASPAYQPSDENPLQLPTFWPE